MMQVAFRPEARLEVLAAREWYDQHVPGLGREFAHAVDRAIASIRQNRFAYDQVEVDCRRVLLRSSITVANLASGESACADNLAGPAAGLAALRPSCSGPCRKDGL